MKAVGAIMVLAGAAYLVFRAREASAALPPVAGEGPGEILYPLDNNRGARRRLSPAEALQLINTVNAEEGLGLDPGDILAFMIVESSLDPTAYRYELSVNDASYGLMQVLSRTARDMGHTGAPSGLYEPLQGTRIGMRYVAWVRDYLAQRLGREPSWDEIASGYNGGPARVVKGWRQLAYTKKWAAARAGVSVA